LLSDVSLKTTRLPHHSHTRMSLYKLWFANRSLVSTSADTRFASTAAGIGLWPEPKHGSIPRHLWPVQ